MISILLFVFLLQLAIYIVNTVVGKQTINDTLWQLYTKLPISSNQDAAALSKLRKEVVRLQRELTATSAQDEFAKWAKLRRQHDKLKDQYETQSNVQKSQRATFDRIASVVRWLSTSGLQFLCNFRFGKTPMFWLPRGWVPMAVEWLLSFPRAPHGAVSINVWSIACASAIALMGDAVMGLWTLKSGVVQEKGSTTTGESVRKNDTVAGAKKTSEKKEL